MQSSEHPTENSTTLGALTTGSDYKDKNYFLKLLHTVTDTRRTRYFSYHGKLRNTIKRAFRQKELKYFITKIMLCNTYI